MARFELGRHAERVARSPFPLPDPSGFGEREGEKCMAERQVMKYSKLKNLSSTEKDALIDALMWFWGISHQQWRVAIEDEYGLDAALRIEKKLMGDLGRKQAKFLKKILNTGEGISELGRAINYAPENYLESYVLESRDENHAVYSNPSCSVQKARVQRGLREYPCREVGLSYLQNFAKQIDPRITVECIIAPPDPHPPDMFCKWRFHLEEQGG